jgi:hypothetical protein
MSIAVSSSYRDGAVSCSARSAEPILEARSSRSVRGPRSPASLAPREGSSMTAPSHIVVVTLENEDYSDIVGNTAEAPSLNQLISGGMLFTNLEGLGTRARPITSRCFLVRRRAPPATLFHPSIRPPSRRWRVRSRKRVTLSAAMPKPVPIPSARPGSTSLIQRPTVAISARSPRPRRASPTCRRSPILCRTTPTT